MLPTSIIVAIQDIKSRIPEGDLVAKLKFAMSEAKQHWLLAKEDEQFRAAVGAVMMHYGEGSEEFKHIAWEMGNVNRFSAALTAAQAGVGVDFGSVLDADTEYKPIGLLDLWHQTR